MKSPLVAGCGRRAILSIWSIGMFGTAQGCSRSVRWNGSRCCAYCIIEQGRVDQILQSNAANRRIIFEEAAGISRFKSRRTEALRRLERVEQNLLRLTDIVDEVESQVSNVDHRLSEPLDSVKSLPELEQLWVGLAADDFRRESVQRELLQAGLKESSSELETLKERQAAAEAELSEADAALSEVDDQLRESERARQNSEVGLPVWSPRFAIWRLASRS